MRYIGNKTRILNEIDGFITHKLQVADGGVFFDAFCGTASVGRHFKDRFRIIANDNLYFSYVMAQALLNGSENMFEKLGFDPFEYFNRQSAEGVNGFFANNYAPALSHRMYFSDANARRIDLIRSTIDIWYADGRIDEREKYFLIASLIESASKVANVAGVYGAYLKDWDPRAQKDMVFFPADDNPHSVYEAAVFNDDTLNVIKQVEGDILYIDPPYTKNQYSVQYHLLETLARNDAPPLRGVTGARYTGELSSDFSKDGKAQVAFERLIADAKFEHIIVSYSSDGIMSREFIESVLKRYGDADSYDFKKFSYRPYKNNRTSEKKDHSEYLFYIRKKKTPLYASPLNFIGGKYDMAQFLVAHMPKDIAVFYDLFAGGFNVGINAPCESAVYNDINFKVKELLEYIADADTAELIVQLKKLVKKYRLQKNGKDAYMALRDKYNSRPLQKRDLKELFLLIMYGFQQQIRFNSKYDYNNPVGQAGFNDKVMEKLISYSRAAKEKAVEYLSEDYENFEERITADDFVYIDPPYLITLGSYNDGKRGFNGWNDAEERRLYAFLDRLNARGVKFMLSNVLNHKDKSNEILKNWLEKSDYRVIACDAPTRGHREEIIVVNYEVDL